MKKVICVVAEPQRVCRRIDNKSPNALSPRLASDLFMQEVL